MTEQEARSALSSLRLERGLSYEVLAREIGGMSLGTVRRFILGHWKPHETTLHAIRTYLNSQPKRGRGKRAAA